MHAACVQMSFVSPKAVRTPAGLVALEPIAAGETVVVFGGRCVGRAEFDDFPSAVQRESLQVDDEVFLVDAATYGPAAGVAHSCDPTCGLRGATTLVTLRAVEAGEALTYDFATSHGTAYNEFECGCAADTCRGKVTGEDWMLPELQLRYRGHFSPYLAHRIAALAASGAGRRAFAY